MREILERDRQLERGLRRASARERAATIANAREETLLESVRHVSGARESASATSVREQLECRLPVTVLEVLEAQSMAMHAQQQIALITRDHGYHLGHGKRIGRLERTS